MISSLCSESTWMCFGKAPVWVGQAWRNVTRPIGRRSRGKEGAEPLLKCRCGDCRSLRWGGYRVLVLTEPSWKAPQSESHCGPISRLPPDDFSHLSFRSSSLMHVFFFPLTFFMNICTMTLRRIVFHFLIHSTQRPNVRKENVCSQRNLCRFHSLKGRQRRRSLPRALIKASEWSEPAVTPLENTVVRNLFWKEFEGWKVKKKKG